MRSGFLNSVRRQATAVGRFQTSKTIFKNPDTRNTVALNLRQLTYGASSDQRMTDRTFPFEALELRILIFRLLMLHVPTPSSAIARSLLRTPIVKRLCETYLLQSFAILVDTYFYGTLFASLYLIYTSSYISSRRMLEVNPIRSVDSLQSAFSGVHFLIFAHPKEGVP